MYGFWCVFPSALFVIHIGGYDAYIAQSIIASMLGLTLSVYAAKFSGAIFGGFDSPIESFNWKDKTLTINY